MTKVFWGTFTDGPIWVPMLLFVAVAVWIGLICYLERRR